MYGIGDVVKALLQVLSQWPVAEGFFIIVISFLGFMTYRRGDKDRKSLGPAAIEIPLFLLSGPVADVMTSVHNMSEQSRITNELLKQLIQELERQNLLMEWVGNQAGLIPHPRKK